MDYLHASKLAPPELATYFRELLSDDPSTDQFTTKSILAAVEQELLAPSVVSIWLSIEKSPKTLLQALTQQFSVSIRRDAIKRFFSMLRGKQWQEMWEGIGGTPGVLALLKEFQGVLGFGIKLAKVTELLQCLLPSNYPEVPFQSSEERPFRESYGYLLPGCTSVFVKDVIYNGEPVEVKSKSEIQREHYQLLRQRCLESLFDSNKSCTDVMTYLPPLIRSAPDMPSNKAKFSESMAFTLLLLEKLASRPDTTPPCPVLTDLIELLIRRMQKKRVDAATTKGVLELALNIAWYMRVPEPGVLLSPTRGRSSTRIGLRNVSRRAASESHTLFNHDERRAENPTLPPVETYVPSYRRSAGRYRESTNRPEVLERAKSAVEDGKSKSVNSREQVDRAFHAKSALFLAISSGSLQLYGETLIWAKRFVRDPLTVKSVFAKSSINTAQRLGLLSGIPEKLYGVVLLNIAQDIKTSNCIILELFEAVVSALKEPSDIIRERLSRSLAVQKALAISDDQIYSVILKSALDLSIRIESIGMQPGYERLGLRSPSGFARLASFKLDEGECGSPPCLRFIDELAKQRDTLWQAFRRSIHPATVLLPPLLPLGLPFQCLISGFDIAFESAYKKTPFIFSRAERVVFAEQELLIPIPDDEEIRAAIGSFVDSFRAAVQIYIRQGPATETQTRAMAAWKHAIAKLSGGMTKEEALRVWQRVFSEAVPTFEIPQLKLPELETNTKWPVLPFDAEIGRYFEWNPLETTSKRQWLSRVRSQISSRFQEDFLQTPGITPPEVTIWSLGRLTHKQLRLPAVLEGLVISALLYLEQFIPNHRSILASPFTSPEAIRYPDIWVDLSFADPDGVVTTPNYNAFDPLRFYLSDIPPSLICRLTEACSDALFEATGESGGNIAQLE
ncbi:hypothetical protein BKA64DRAFT_710121 [Cadophora sp. MPI-SDFR-AT-0126]|nr:hypothetical protein BKA64DRAFT_710121 [Leotiomycetes sp. MPI-SDFR-AT-0126]